MRALSTLVIFLPLGVAFADGDGPAKMDIDKATKKGTAVQTKAGALESANIEFHVQSKKEGNAVVDVQVYLYDTEAGSPLKSLTGKVVCNPCDVRVGGETQVHKMNLGETFEAKGGFPKATPKATGLVVVGTDNFEDVSFVQVNTGDYALELNTLFITRKDFDKAAETAE